LGDVGVVYAKGVGAIPIQIVSSSYTAIDIIAFLGSAKLFDDIPATMLHTDLQTEAFRVEDDLLYS
jgi:hypothetical protein